MVVIVVVSRSLSSGSCEVSRIGRGGGLRKVGRAACEGGIEDPLRDRAYVLRKMDEDKARSKLGNTERLLRTLKGVSECKMVPQ